MKEYRRSMWMVAAFAVFFVTTFGSEYSSRPDFSTYRHLQVSSSDEFDNSSQLVVRQPRAVNTKTDELLQKTSIVARIVNSIYLQAGLLDNTVPVEDVVGELLNLGSTKVSEIASFDWKKVKDLMAQIKGFPASLDSATETLEMENFIVGYDVIRSRSQSVRNKSALGTFSAYFAKLQTREATLSVPKLDAAFKPFKEIIDLWPKVKLIDNTTTRNNADDGIIVFNLKKQLENAITQLPKIDDITKDMKALGDLTLEDLNPIIIVADLLKYRMNVVPTTIGDSGVKNNEKLLTGLNPTASGAKPDIERLLNLVSNRMKPNTVQRTHSTAFVRGITDMQKLSDDIKDIWLKEVFAKHGELLKLEYGLKPFLKLKSDVTTLSAKLDPISKKELLSAIQTVSRYMTEIGTVVSITDAEIDTLTRESMDCSRKGNPPNQAHIFPIEDSVKKARQLKAKFSNPPRLGETKQSLQELSGLFKNLPNNPNELQNLSIAFIGNLNSTGKLEEFENLIANWTSQLTSFNYASAVQNISGVMNTQSSYKTFQEHQNTNQEMELYTCLHAMDDKVEKLAKALEVKKNLLSFDTNEAAIVENAVTVMENLSTDFSKVKDIPTLMKKEVSEASESLDKLEEAKASTEFLGNAVVGLYSIQQFGEIEPSLTKLKEVGPYVDSQLEKIVDPQQKTNLQQKWGNHQSDMANVDTVLGQVRQIESGLNLANIKKLKDLGAPLASLSSVTDVSMKVKDKLEVLETLISSSTAATVDPKLSDAKEVLEPIDGLQLAFSSYHPGFSQSLGVLGAFESFLAPYLVQKHDPIRDPQTIGEDDSDSDSVHGNPANGGMAEKVIEKTESYLVLVISLIVIIIVLIAVAVSLLYIWYRHPIGKKLKYKHRKLRSLQIEQTVAGQAHAGFIASSHYHGGVLRTIYRVGDGNRLNLDSIYSRHGIACNPKTAVKIWNGPIPHIGEPTLIHANWIITESGKKFIGTQGPMKYKEGVNVPVEPPPQILKNDTCEHFWHMVFNYGVENIVMLCNFFEDGNSKCGQYFPPEGKTEKYGCFTVQTTTEGVEIKDKAGIDDVIRRTIYVTKGRKTKIFNHYQYIHWPDMAVPNDPTTAVQLMKIVDKSEKPIVVHCSAGIGRTMAFIGIKYIADCFEMYENAQFDELMAKLRMQRHSAFPRWRQSYFVQVAVVLYLQQKYKHDFKQDNFTPQLELFQKTIVKDDKKLNMAEVLGDEVIKAMKKLEKLYDGKKA